MNKGSKNLALLAAFFAGCATARPWTLPEAPGGTTCLEGDEAGSFDPMLAARLQATVENALKNADANYPAAALRVSGPGIGTWSCASGLADIRTGATMKPGDRFRAGSIMKPFVAAVALQLVEEGRLSLDDTLADRLPGMTGKVKNADRITITMLLRHTAGIGEFLDAEGVMDAIVENPKRIWKDEEWVSHGTSLEPYFAPGKGWRYSNTDYVLLGMIIEKVTGQSWREEVRQRVIAKLELKNTVLPEPGDTSIPGSHAHGYLVDGGDATDVTAFDPSMAGAAGGSALVTTLADLSAFMDALLAGQLFQKTETLTHMMSFEKAEYDGGAVGYGLGLQRYMWPENREAIGHGGGTAGYRSLVVKLPARRITLSMVITNMNGDPKDIVFPAVDILFAATTR